ncbi:hypothetical protein C2E23DRAFT_856716 [Lenzites betulinus]|nr:hypothetical protein C2E23DRAFT_856716 [Lenzites betulinus]
MYPSPAYEPAELPTLRRMKPLPKRRRTSAEHPAPAAPLSTTASPPASEPDDSEEDGPDGVSAGAERMTAQIALQAYYAPVLGGVRELVRLGAPAAGGEPPLDLSSGLAASGFGLSLGLGPYTGAGYGYGYDGAGGGGAGLDGRDGLDDDESGEGDYIDHLQQPGNTKKRKVPANMSGSAHGHDGGSSGEGAEEELADRAIPTGHERDGEASPVRGGVNAGGGDGGGGGGGGGLGIGYGSVLGMILQSRSGRRGRLTRATLAGLQYKEILRSRKRQVAAVLGPAHDTLAIEQALSANYPFLQAGLDYRSGASVPVRPSRRREARIARAFKAYKEALAEEHIEEPPQVPQQPQATAAGTAAPAPRPDKSPPAAPTSDFAFVCHSATSDRLAATAASVAHLHGQFEEELARQAAKAADAAKQAAAASASSALAAGPAAKRTDRTDAAHPSADPGKGGAVAGGASADAPAKGKGGKKKKRSALANASNPHHLRNYVPSRLPHSGPPSAQQAAQNAQNMLSPLPLRFLAAEIPPRRRKKADAAAAQQPGQGLPAGQQVPAGLAPAPPPLAPASTLANAAEEWICPFCEYQLFYGDDSSYHRAVRNRKKILRRRRRARERAAAAASGVAPATGGAGTGAMVTGVAPASAFAPIGPGYEDVGDAPVVPKDGGTGTSPAKGAKWKEGDRGGRGAAAAAAHA